MKRAVVVLMWVAAAELQAAALFSVGVLDPASPYSELRAISSDGDYAVGTSRAPSGVNVPVIWSVADGLVALPNPSGANSTAHGVAVGTGTNAGNVIISGLHENNITHRFYKAPLSSPASGAWTDTATAGGLGGTSNVRGGTSNVLRSDRFFGGTGDGRWYVAGRRNDSGRVARFRGDPDIGWDGSGSMTGDSVSAAGVVVGRYTGVSPSKARWDSPQGDTGDVPGDGGFRADGIGISPSFGRSTTEHFDVQWICGQNQSAPGNNMQAFRWQRGEPSMQLLGMLPGATSSVAYSIADNGVAAGRSHFGDATPTFELATVWDPTGLPQSLKDLLDAAGVDTSAWTRLARVFALSDDGTALAGFGIWAADGSTRGFVARLDDFPTVGACCVRTGLGTGTCSVVGSSECAELSGTYLGDGMPCGPDAANCGDFCPVPFADADYDGDVDQADFGIFQACLTGVTPGVPAGCECLNPISDQVIDDSDYLEFEKCVTGPAIPFDLDNPGGCAL
jgi:hypothetical protein